MLLAVSDGARGIVGDGRSGKGEDEMSRNYINDEEDEDNADNDDDDDENDDDVISLEVDDELRSKVKAALGEAAAHSDVEVAATLAHTAS